jgi:hypothetical protein
MTTQVKPSGKGLKKALRKLVRLSSRGVRPRVLRRLSMRCVQLKANYERRLNAWKAAEPKEGT